MERRDFSNPDTGYDGIRTCNGSKYLEYEGGFREFYDLNTDPYELTDQSL